MTCWLIGSGMITCEPLIAKFYAQVNAKTRSRIADLNCNDVLDADDNEYERE